ncbi:MAG: serine/threonine-protein kinase [Ruminococcus sp.]|nr:serine/threonine-protein kinase [Ruminococcus sp.]
MSGIVNSTYEIIGKLGAGGGGVVYLAEHLRLGKKVVLKADKRNVSTKPELLRREVDVLKELNNPYIPIVYDYFIEDGISYTVMDYVDGQSLDKRLRTGETFSPPDVIRWARQLLNALSYLHSPTHGDPPRGYIHSDIKPANIMLRPGGDVCLIDFNISLAIGIETVVGKSEGYASPEHYGLDYSFGGNNEGDETVRKNESDKTELAGDKTELMGQEESKEESRSVSASGSFSSSFKKVVVPDARSDIYSLGATMYHLLSGNKPARDAKEVVPLSKKEYPAMLADIITKAMDPNPDLRYSSAGEMLAALEGLWKNDPRVRRQRKRFVFNSTVTVFLLAAGLGAWLTGTKQNELIQAGEVLASQSAQALSRGDVKTAVSLALQAIPENAGAFDIPYTPAAEMSLTKALGVYDLADSFKADKIITLPSSPFRLVKSPDEKKFAVTYAYELAVYDIETGESLAVLPTLESALCEVEFIDNGRIIYGGKEGLTVYDISAGRSLWQGEKATAIALSGDGKTAAAVYKKDSLVNFYNVDDGEKIGELSLGDMHFNIPENDLFADAFRDVFELNEDGSALAISLNGGYLGVVDLYGGAGGIDICDTSDYAWFKGKFMGDIFAFCAGNTKGSVFSIADYRNMMFLRQMKSDTPFDIKVYRNELYVSRNDSVVLMNTETFEQTPVAYTENKNISDFDISNKYAFCAFEDGFRISYKGIIGDMQTEETENAPDFLLMTDSRAVYGDRNSPVIRVLKMSEGKGDVLMEYDPAIYHSEARLCEKTGGVMLFNIYGFTLLNPDGSVKLTCELPDPDTIYDQQYRRGMGESDYLEVIYYSGRQVCYSADDGSIIADREVTPPEKYAGEEFETSEYTVRSPLHGAPEVYDKLSGDFVKTLRGEDYLTYITETGDRLIAQYRASAGGSAYGVVMNPDWEETALLPYLCDICGDTLIFDLPGGVIKTSPIYGRVELRKMAGNTSS